MNDFPKLLDPDQALARELFDQLAEAMGAGDDSRAVYGEGEGAAQDILRRAGEFLDLEVHSDAALNLYLTYPGADRERPVVVIGGYLDAPLSQETQAARREAPQKDKSSLTPTGGAVGVVAGIAVFAFPAFVWSVYTTYYFTSSLFLER